MSRTLSIIMKCNVLYCGSHDLCTMMLFIFHANQTINQVISKVKLQPISCTYKKRLLSYMHTIYSENCPHLLSMPIVKR